MALPLGDGDRAIAALVEAAREATARTAFDEAAAHLRRAVDMAGGETAADLATLCEHGDALRCAGSGEDARAAFFAAAARALRLLSPLHGAGRCERSSVTSGATHTFK